MFRLFEIKKTNDKETQSIYPFDSKIEAEGEFDVKVGTATQATDEQAHFFMVLDNIGSVVASAFIGEGEISPRLIDVKVTTEEVPNMAKYDTVNDVHANFHLKRGRAKQNEGVKAIMLRGLDEKGNSIEYDYWVRPIDYVEPEPEIPEEPVEE